MLACLHIYIYIYIDNMCEHTDICTHRFMYLYKCRYFMHHFYK